MAVFDHLKGLRLRKDITYQGHPTRGSSTSRVSPDHILPWVAAEAQLGKGTFPASCGLGMSPVFTENPLWPLLRAVKLFLASISSSGKGGPQWHCASQTG